jgi:hypothetical protein
MQEEKSTLPDKTLLPNKEEEEEDDDDSNPWKTIGLGFLLLFGAFYLYYVFNDFENSTQESMKINWLFALLYNIGGKWTVSIILGAIGALLVFLGVKEFRDEKE